MGLHHIIDVVAPSAPPPALGMHFVDTVAKRTWLSVGTGSVGDWLESGLDVSSLLTTVGTLASDVTALQGDVATLQGDVTTLQADVAGALGAIGTLQSDVGTLQTDVATLQSDYAALQGDVAALLTFTGNLLNFRDSGSGGHTDASIYYNSGVTEGIKLLGASGYLQFNGQRIMRDVTNSQLGLLSGTSKGTGAFVEVYGDTHASTPGLVMVTTKGRASSSNGNLQIFNNDIAQSSGDLRLQMFWEGNFLHQPTWPTTGTYIGFRMNVSDSGPANANSSLIDLQISSSSKFKVRKDGEGTFAAGVGVTGWVTMANSTAPGSNPTNGAIWANAGELQYRTSGTNEGAGQTNRLHNRAEVVNCSGTDYTFTGTTTAVTFGTVSPLIDLPTAGTYFVYACTGCLADAAGGADAMAVILYNVTDATSANLGGSKVMSTGLGSISESTVMFAVYTVNATKQITIRAVNSTAARGTLFSTRTSIGYIRLY